MTVQARMLCHYITDYGVENKHVCLKPVIGGSGNESYSKWTPNGNLELTITNPEAAVQFVPGRVYDVVISEVN